MVTRVLLQRSIRLLIIIALVVSLSLFISFSPAAAQSSLPAGVVVVTPTGTGDGLSWQTPTALQDALTPGGNVDPTTISGIWVAAGTYTPGTQRTNTFQLVDGIAIYGGFAGSETARSQRNPNPATNNTILSGDLLGDDGPDGPDDDSIPDTGRDDNAFHVVTGSGTDATAVLDGVTITAGNADDGGSSCPNNCGGGVYNDNGSPTLTNVTIQASTATLGGGINNDNGSSPTLFNVTIQGNVVNGFAGGGMSNNDGSPTLTNVIIQGNAVLSGFGGGGMFNFDSSPTLTNVIIQDNTTIGSGGGIRSENGIPVLINVTVRGNTAEGFGGGVFNLNSSPVLTNVTIQGNSATNNGGGMSNTGSTTPTIQNSIIWGNTPAAPQVSENSGSATTYNHSLVQGVVAATLDASGGTGNLDSTNPTFADEANGDLRLQAGSPVIDQGDAQFLTADIQTDLSGNMRVVDGDTDGSAQVDLGAFEYQIPGITLDLGQLTVTEGGSTDAYSMVLDTQPYANVTITLASGNNVTLDPTTLTFTPANWATPQTVTVTAVDDSTDEPNENATISHTITSNDSGYDGLTLEDITVTIQDDDGAGVLVNAGSVNVTEGGSTDTYSLVLTSQPTDDVIITLASGNNVTLDPTTLTFTPANWATPQTVTVTAVDDTNEETGETATITHTVTSADAGYAGITIADVAVTISDNDTESNPTDPSDPTLTINFSRGAPGSTFVVTGENLLPDATYAVRVNNSVIGTATSDADGTLIIIIATSPDTAPGDYEVTVAPTTGVAQDAILQVRYTIDRATPQREAPPDLPPNVTPLSVPATIAPANAQRVYVPLVARL